MDPGKSTVTSVLDFAGHENLLDADAFARRLSPSDLRCAAIASGREVVSRIQNYLRNRVSFAIETTLASRRTLPPPLCPGPGKPARGRSHC